MTATANLVALHAAAVSGDWSAMLLLADLAEAGMDDARADAWRWLADPPRKGWEWRAVSVLLAGVARHRRDVQAGGYRVRATCARGARLTVWDEELYWRWEAALKTRNTPAPPGVREACLAACRLAVGR
jgi:hypothetical protein